MSNLVLDKRLLNKPKEKYWITYIKRRVAQNKNFLGFISGPTGSSKSWSSLSIGEQLDKSFNIEHVVFSAIELMDLINSGKLKKGSVIIFEEVGVEINSKNWYTTINKMMNYLLQTFRHKNFVLIMNSPYMDYLDSSMKKLFHAEIETVSIDFTTNEARLKPRLIQYNSKYKKFYYKKLRAITKEGVQTIGIWRVRKPSRQLIRDYEDKKDLYTSGLNERISYELSNKSIKKLTVIQEEVIKYLKQGLKIPEIAKIRGVSERAIHQTMDFIRNKGYKINKIILTGNRVKNYEVIEPR